MIGLNGFYRESSKGENPKEKKNFALFSPADVIVMNLFLSSALRRIQISDNMA